MIGNTVSHYRIIEKLGEGRRGSYLLRPRWGPIRHIEIKVPSVSAHQTSYLDVAILTSRSKLVESENGENAMSIQKRLSCVIAVSLLYMLGLLSLASGNLALASAWTTKAPMPTARYLFSLGEVNGKLYAIGGSTSGGNSAVVVEVYDRATDT